jgi:hypothetical protein
MEILKFDAAKIVAPTAAAWVACSVASDLCPQKSFRMKPSYQISF